MKIFGAFADERGLRRILYLEDNLRREPNHTQKNLFFNFSAMSYDEKPSLYRVRDNSESVAQLQAYTNSAEKPKQRPSQPQGQGLYRSRDNSSSVAQLAAFTNSSQKVAPKAILKEDAGYDDEEFEDYDDDFDAEEEEDKKPVAQSQSKEREIAVPPKASAKTSKQTLRVDSTSASISTSNSSSSSSSSSSFVLGKEKDYIDSTANSKTKVKDEKKTKHGFGSSNTTTSSSGGGGGMSNSSIADPRLFRIQKIRDSGVMDMQMEKFTQLTLLPSTKYGLYMSDLRVSEPAMKQVFLGGLTTCVFVVILLISLC